MNNWWEIAFSAMCLAALGCLALGLILGYRYGHTDGEIEAAIARHPAGNRQPRGQLPAAPKHASPSTTDLFARLEAEVRPATITMQPPIRALVQPGRHSASYPRRESVTDMIARFEAETDAYIAAMRSLCARPSGPSTSSPDSPR